MYRSGSTLQYQIASALVEAAGVGRRLGWDWASADLSLAKPGASFGVIKVHEPHPEQGVEAGLAPEGVRYIYSHRDLRDVVVSFAAKVGVDLKEPPDEQNTAWMGVMMRAHAHFTSRKRVLVRGYDEIVRDVAGEVRVIRDFLGLRVGDAACRAIAADVSVEKQRERMAAAAPAGEGELKWESTSLVHHNHIRDGRSGQWLKQLPPAWVEHVERRYGEWLRVNGYAVEHQRLFAAGG
jgi:hypothetical protein